MMHSTRARAAFLFATLLLVLTGCARSGSDSASGAAAIAARTSVADAVFSSTIYTYTFPETLTGVATGDFYDPAHSYPPIPVDPKYTHALTFQMTPFAPPAREVVPGNGPLVLFSDDLDVLVFSPLDHFFVSLIDFQDGQINYGIEGEVEEVPAGMVHRFLLVRGKGIRATIDYWGDRMRAEGGHTRPDRYADTGLSTLGYWTDNGAAYYYKTRPGWNEQGTLLAVKEEADRLGVPYGYVQLDSWWYYKEPGFPAPKGLIRWEPLPEMFPQGLAAFREKLGLPLIAHNRWFAPLNDYLADHPFAIEEKMALPLDRSVFDRFMDDAAVWGVQTYEQDWLISQIWGLKYLRDHVDHAESWMRDLDDAAADRGLTMQVCMPGAAHLMDAIYRRSWTTARTSTDYRKDVSKESYWPQFHTINLLAYAVGLWPFKDNFRSAEKHGEAEALISVLSAGMVGASDGLGETKPDILRRTCRADGLLLKPDRPAFPVDAMFLEHARPYTTATYSARAGLGRWTYLSAYHLARGHAERSLLDRLWGLISYGGTDLGRMFVFPEAVTDWRVDLAADLGIAGPVVAYDWRTGEARVARGTLDLPVREHLYDFDYFVLAPILPGGLALLGETGKYVTVADKRFSAIDARADAIDVTLAGTPGEEVEVRAFDAISGSMLAPVTATIGDDGTAVATIGRSR
jgi:hypothetical protein